MNAVDLAMPAAHRRRAASPVSGVSEPAMRRWALLQEAEDLISAAQRRDPTTLLPLPWPWTSALPAFHEALTAEGRPPRTRIVGLCERLADHLDAVIAQPRAKLAREHELLRLHQVRVMDAKCRRWYARQSGGTPVEKAGRRGRLLGVRRRQSVDVVENRLVAAVAKALLPRVAGYLRAWRPHAPQHPHVLAVERANRSLRRWLGHPELGSLRPSTTRVRPTYALLRDVHYRALWDVHVSLRREDEDAQAAWDRLGRTVGELEILATYAALHHAFNAMVDGVALIRGPTAGVGSRFSSGPPGTAVCVIDHAVWVLDGDASQPRCVTLRAQKSSRRQELELESWREGEPLRPHLMRTMQSALEWVHELGRVERVSWARAPTSRQTEVSSAWGPASFDGDLVGRVLTGWRVSEAEPVSIRQLAGSAVAAESEGLEVRIGPDLWRELRRGGDGAGAAILRSAFGGDAAWRPERALVVPEDLDVAAVRALSSGAPATRQLWLLPRSIACVLGLANAAPEGTVGVLCLGEESGTVNVLESRPSDGVSEWLHGRCEAFGLPGFGSILDVVLQRALDREGHREPPTHLQRACWYQTVASAPERRSPWLDTIVDEEWRRVVVQDADWDAACDDFLGRLELDLPSHVDEWIVEGLPAWLPELRARIRTRLATRVRFTDGPEVLIRGASAFLDRRRRGAATYVEVLPRIELQVVQAWNRMREWKVVLDGVEVAPGERRAERLRGYGRLMAGEALDVTLPVRVDGRELPVRARWRDDRVRLREPVPFDVEVAWVGGLGGLRVDFVPSDPRSSVARRTLDWERAGVIGDARPVRNVFPAPVHGGLFGPSDLDALARQWDALRKELKERGRGTVQQRRLVELVKAMPGTGWRVPEERAREEWQHLASELGVLAGWGIDARLGKSEKRSAQALGLGSSNLAVFGGRGAPALVRLAGRFGTEAPDFVIARVLEALPLFVRDRKGRRQLRRSDDEVSEWMRTAGRLAATAGPKGIAVLPVLVNLGAGFVDDPCIEAWVWAVGSALLIGEDIAKSLADEEVERLTGVLLAVGAAAPSALRAEVGSALLGLTRVREGRQARFGPASDWTTRVLAALEGLRAEQDENAKLRLRLESGRRLWPALEETLRGTREVLVEGL